MTPGLERLIDLLRERSKTLVEMAERARFLVGDELAYDREGRAQAPEARDPPASSRISARPRRPGDWSERDRGGLRRVRAAHGELALGKLAQPVRVAVTGGAVSPGIFETLAALGKDQREPHRAAIESPGRVGAVEEMTCLRYRRGTRDRSPVVQW